MDRRPLGELNHRRPALRRRCASTRGRGRRFLAAPTDVGRLGASYRRTPRVITAVKEESMIFIVRTWSVASVGALFLTIGPLSGCGSGTGTSGGGGSSSPTSSTPLLGVPRLTPQSTPATVSAATSPRSAFLPDRSW